MAKVIAFARTKARIERHVSDAVDRHIKSKQKKRGR